MELYYLIQLEESFSRYLEHALYRKSSETKTP